MRCGESCSLLRAEGVRINTEDRTVSPREKDSCQLFSDVPKQQAPRLSLNSSISYIEFKTFVMDCVG